MFSLGQGWAPQPSEYCSGHAQIWDTIFGWSCIPLFFLSRQRINLTSIFPATVICSVSARSLLTGGCFLLQDDTKPWESAADPWQYTSSIAMWPVWAPCLTCTLCRPLIVPPSRGCLKHHDPWSGITWWEQFEPLELRSHGLIGCK